MKVLFVDTNHPVLEQMLCEAGFICEPAYGLDGADLLEKVKQAQGIVIRSRIKLTKDILKDCAQLKFIARAGAGMENIDVEYAQKMGIKCFHAPEGNSAAVGEHAIGMLLSLMNNLIKADIEVREGKWIREGNRGEELEGKTVGIIGYGNMGKAFAKRLIGFGVKILAHDKYLKDFGDSVVKESTLEELFNSADVVSIHLPLTAETHYYAGEVFFKSFKKNIWFINTARGKCCDTQYLVKAIKEGRVKGACLDVLEYESVSFEHINQDTLPESLRFLMSSSKVQLSPHIAGWTKESHEKIAARLAEKIIKEFS